MIFGGTLDVKLWLVLFGGKGGRTTLERQEDMPVSFLMAERAKEEFVR